MPSTQMNVRVRALVLGGGIHGCGVLHDLASRGWTDCALVEKESLGFGTSSRSTKLIHGGLRYLEHVRDFSLVAEGLKERKLLMNLAPDLVKPLEFVFPVLKKGGMPRFMIKAGLTLYDGLAGSQGIGRHKSLSEEVVLNLIPTLDSSKFKHYYRFFDGQTDDLALVVRVASSAKKLGTRIYEQTIAKRIRPTDDGFEVEIESQGKTQIVSTRYIINAMGPWAHSILNASNIKTSYEGINIQGAHILTRDLGLKAGLFLQSPADKRIFFVLPWQGHTLIGTTENEFISDPDALQTSEDQIDYLLERSNQYLSKKILRNDVIARFSGLRWLARDPEAALTDTSRSHVVATHRMGKGVIYTIYGGKLTAYRALCEEVGDMIMKDFGDEKPSQTAAKSFWCRPDECPPVHAVPERFKDYK